MAFKRQALTREQLQNVVSQVITQAEAQDLQAHMNAVGSAAANAAMRAEMNRLLAGVEEPGDVQSNNA